jgi:hypothetical protein
MAKSSFGIFVARTEPLRHGMFSLEDWLHLMFMNNAGCLQGMSSLTLCTYAMMLTKFLRLGALPPSNWRTQRAVVYSIPHSNILSTVGMNTGLTASPTRGFPSQFMPRLGSIVFHPTEMLYGVGSPDGTGTCVILHEEKFHSGSCHQYASTAPT